MIDMQVDDLEVDIVRLFIRMGCVEHFFILTKANRKP